MPTFDVDAQRVYALLDRIATEAEESSIQTPRVQDVSFVEPFRVAKLATTTFPPGGEAVELLAVR